MNIHGNNSWIFMNVKWHLEYTWINFKWITKNKHEYYKLEYSGIFMNMKKSKWGLNTGIFWNKDEYYEFRWDTNSHLENPKTWINMNLNMNWNNCQLSGNVTIVTLS